MSTTQGPPPAVGIDDAFGRGFAAARRELGDLVDTPTWSLDDLDWRDVGTAIDPMKVTLDAEVPAGRGGRSAAGPAAPAALAPSLHS